ncbi:MAG: SHOCT domain-containing protein [Dehalococcoidia bacterium]|nr:MAG: SHOCT domain-containing protein [Dehalococcoidia bacterium]
MVSTVLVVGGVGAVILWASGAFSQPPRQAPPSSPSDARDLLDARYARGEITREQYQQMREDIES